MTLRRWLVAAAVFAAPLAGCSHEIKSPDVTAGSGATAVDPDLVCVEQLTTAITLHGDGFTPMPSKTLESPTQLLLPTVVLNRTQGLAPESPGGDSYTIPDDPANTTASHVRWASEQQMGFDAFPELKLQPGLYDVVVTNPDGSKTTTFTGGLAGVPRPALTTVAPDIQCDAQGDDVFVLTGTGLLSVGSTLPVVHVAGSAGTKDFTVSKVDGCADVPGTHALGKVQTCSKATFTIPKGTFDPGKYNLTLTNPAPASCVSTDKIELTIVPPPTVASIQPDLICDEQGDQTLKITGTGFLQIGTTLPKITVGTKDFPATKVENCTAIAGPFAEGDVQTCTTVDFTIPQGSFPEGDYDVVVTNPDPPNCHSVEKLTLHVAPPPSITSIVPDLVCDAQGDQQMTINGKNFLEVGGAFPAIDLGGKPMTATGDGGCVTVPGTFAEGTIRECTSLTFTIPLGTYPEGDYAVTVTNPTPADCHSTETISLHVAPPPSIDATATLAICDAQGDQTVTITGSKFLSLGTASGDGGAATTLPSVQIGSMTFTPTAAGGCVPVTGTFTEGTVQECTSLTVTVPKGAFASGDFPVVVTNPAPADCHSTETVNLHVEPPPTVSSLAPATLCQGGGQITINGQGFIPTPSVTLESAGSTVATSIGATVNTAGTQIAATFAVGGVPGTQYDVVVKNPDGCTDATPHQTVTVVAGPIAFFADPEVVYNGINTRVTIYATTLQQPLPANAVTIVPAGQSTPVTTLTWAPVPGHPNRVQVVIPTGQAPGVYDLMMNDATGCSTILPNALTVTSTLSVTLKSVIPPFGYNATETAVTILRDKAAPPPANVPFVATPRVFLNPTNPQPTDTAIQVESVSFGDDATLTAVVPKNQPVHAYDLIVVNPDGTVGYLANAFTVQSVPPPTIAAVTPSSIVAATAQVVTVSAQDLNGSTVTLSCVDANGNSVAAPAVTSGTVNCTGSGCTQTATINASALPVGSICILRETNADGSYFDYSAIGVTGPSLNLPGTHAGTAMNVGRRALAAASADATSAARFVYAIGGDGGQALASAPFSSVELASVDLFGKMGPWSSARSSLGTARSFAASGKMGRYIYVAGGSDGTSALASAERAMVLSPREVPLMDIDDLVPAATGLDAGYWSYRVSATFAASDTDNPGGESLPSDEFIVKVPSFTGKKIQVVLAWTAPVDSLGAPLPNVSGYNVYRTAAVNGASGSEVLLTTVSGTTLKYTDDGAATPGTQTPLPLGSTGNWAQLPAMATARKGAAGAIAFDPVTANKFYFYSLLGLNQANAAQTSYEYLPVTIQPNGHQTVGTWTAGSSGVGQGRWQLGAFVADSTVSSTIPAGTTYVYFGGGIDAANTAANAVDAGKVAAGGDLGTISATPKDFSSNSAGYGVCAANDQLFAFGGAGAAPSAGAKSASIVSPAPSLALNSWNSEGINLVDSRYLMGSSVQSAFIFLVGGQTATSPASTSTELVIW